MNKVGISQCGSHWLFSCITGLSQGRAVFWFWDRVCSVTSQELVVATLQTTDMGQPAPGARVGKHQKRPHADPRDWVSDEKWHQEATPPGAQHACHCFLPAPASNPEPPRSGRSASAASTQRPRVTEDAVPASRRQHPRSSPASLLRCAVPRGSPFPMGGDIYDPFAF